MAMVGAAPRMRGHAHRSLAPPPPPPRTAGRKSRPPGPCAPQGRLRMQQRLVGLAQDHPARPDCLFHGRPMPGGPPAGTRIVVGLNDDLDSALECWIAHTEPWRALDSPGRLPIQARRSRVPLGADDQSTKGVAVLARRQHRARASQELASTPSCALPSSYTPLPCLSARHAIPPSFQLD